MPIERKPEKGEVVSSLAGLQLPVTTGAAPSAALPGIVPTPNTRETRTAQVSQQTPCATIREAANRPPAMRL